MELAFYFYTIFVMLACIAAGTTALSAYFVSRRHLYLLGVALFFFYFFDLTLIFQYEYLGQNITYPFDSFYSIDKPILKTLIALGILESLWLIICDYLNTKSKILALMPAVIFVLASFLLVGYMPEGAWKQWCFYTLRQLFLLWCLGYALARYLYTKKEVDRIRLGRQKSLFFITLLLVFCTLIEDSVMILVWVPDSHTTLSLLPLYISERNFSENILLLVFAFFTLREAAATLKLRFREPPTSENPTFQQHIDDLLPSFCNRHSLTQRECDILARVLLDKDNQNIASDLHLAVGTIKAHVHNILKKTGYATRQELMRNFWKE